jgi:predicted nucleic acid-binding protein
MKKTVTIPSASNLFLVDSSGWLEHLIAGPKAQDFMPYLQDESNLVVPTIVIYEVYKKLRRVASENLPDVFLSAALRCRVISCGPDIAIAAAHASLKHRLAMADAIVFATAESCGAQIATTDPDFKGLPGAVFL